MISRYNIFGWGWVQNKCHSLLLAKLYFLGVLGSKYQTDKFWDCRDSILGQQVEKQECYLCAIPLPPSNTSSRYNVLNRGLHHEKMKEKLV